MNKSYLVVKQSTKDGTLNPKTAIEISVDTAYVAGQSGNAISKGIYMVDNRVASGSSGEGTLELHTHCPVGDLIGFKVVPLNALGNSGDKVEITGFTVTQGSVFTAAGQPIKHSKDGSYWIGQALGIGSQTQQIQIKITVGILHQVSYFFNWTSSIAAS